MTGVGVSGDRVGESLAEPRDPRPPRGSARRYLLSAAVLAVVAGTVTGAWWWRHPTAFHAAPQQPSLGLGETEAAGGAPLHVEMAHPLRDVRGSAVLTGVEPHVVSNTANAVLTFQVCVPTVRGAFISVRGDLSRWCDAVGDLDGATLPLELNDTDRPPPQVVMTIRSGQPGELRVQGIDLSYQHGRQGGTQRVGEYVWLRYD